MASLVVKRKMHYNEFEKTRTNFLEKYSLGIFLRKKQKKL